MIPNFSDLHDRFSKSPATKTKEHNIQRLNKNTNLVKGTKTLLGHFYYDIDYLFRLTGSVMDKVLTNLLIALVVVLIIVIGVMAFACKDCCKRRESITSKYVCIPFCFYCMYQKKSIATKTRHQS